MYFEGYYFSQNPVFRPVLEKYAPYRTAACLLTKSGRVHGTARPAYRFTDHANLFKAVISNQAAFTQTYPNVRLILLDYTGKPFTHRVFRPQEYLPEALVTTPVMISDATAEISLNIAAPETKVGGYTFDLTY
jgi:hypothetical protein